MPVGKANRKVSHLVQYLSTWIMSSSETQGQSVGSGEKARRKFSSKGGRAPGHRLSPDHFQKFKQMPAPDWAQKMLCIIVPNWRAHLLSSFRVFVHDGYCTACRGHAPKKCTQSGNFQFDIDFPYDFKILSARKLKTLFQKYKLQLTTGIHACIGHVLRRYIYREYLKDTTTETSHGKVNLYFCSVSIVIIPTRFLWQMQANSSWAEFLSTISKFMKRMNFVIACLRPSQNVKLGIFTGSRVVDGKEMYKKAWCTCKVVVLPCQAFAYLTFLSPPHLKLPIMSYYLRYTVIRQKQNIRAKFNCSCW